MTTDTMHIPCQVCGQIINRYTDRWYSLFDIPTRIIAFKIICQPCKINIDAKSSRPHYFVVDMTDDYSRVQVAHAACTGIT